MRVRQGMTMAPGPQTSPCLEIRVLPKTIKCGVGGGNAPCQGSRPPHQSKAHQSPQERMIGGEEAGVLLFGLGCQSLALFLKA